MERKFLLLPGWVQVDLERGAAPGEIVPVLAEAATLARNKQREGLLVVSGLDDPASAPAICDALRLMKDAGAPPPSRIAFVAYLLEQYEAYHFAMHAARDLGFEASLFVAIDDAKVWLARR